MTSTTSSFFVSGGGGYPVEQATNPMAAARNNEINPGHKSDFFDSCEFCDFLITISPFLFLPELNRQLHVYYG